ncbi:MAG: hypothetical protein KAS86_03920 [Candidatus Omnitrophica bacterium]|nr:hypothetical protein [Candidatus Omnitrophota bacterium]
MENGLIWFLGLAIISLTQALVLILKFTASRSEKKSVPVISEESDNPGYGERIGQSETEIKNMKENNEKDHRLMRRDIRKLFTLLNGMK